MSPTSQETAVFRLGHDVILETFDNGALILDVEDLGLTELNTSARDILANTDGKRTASQVASILAKEYDIEPSQSLRDVLGLYQHLAGQKIVEEV